MVPELRYDTLAIGDGATDPNNRNRAAGHKAIPRGTREPG
jgi:hypothetical protein